MANDEFQFPGQPQERPLESALDIADSIEYSPERQPGAYERIKLSENRIHGYRRTALEIDAKRPEQTFFEIMLQGRRDKLSLEKLIESETLIGGMPYARGEITDPRVAKVVDRFWLSHKGSSALVNGNDLGDWYHDRRAFDSFGRQLSEVTIHLETHPTHINKIVGGRPVSLTIAELETFIRAVELYEQNIREQLYPFDQEIFDLLEEIDQDNPILPESVEERFGKEIVARVIEAYKAQKRIKDLQMPQNVDEFVARSTVIPNTVEEMFPAQTIEERRADMRTRL